MGRTNLRKKVGWFVLSMLLVFGTCLGSCLAFVWFQQPPSDQAMIENLAAHRATFEALIAMIQHDAGLERVDEDWTRPEDTTSIGVSRERIALYRKLCNEAGVPRGFYSFDDAHTIIFVMYSRGLSISGASKSYVYSDLPQQSTTSGALDAYHRKPKVNVSRDLGGGWSLAFDST
jgi:hypothetical protein